MPVRGIRGAVRVAANTRDAILAGTRSLIRAILDENRVKAEDVASAIFTVSPDLNAEFPAYVTREMKDWKFVPLLCAQELAVPGGMDRVVRVLLLVNTDAPQEQIRHQYLGETACLRPDLESTPSRTRLRKPSIPARPSPRS